MSSFMRETLMDTEMLAIHQDRLGIAGGLLMYDTTSPGCVGDIHMACQMWGRPLTGGRWAMALYLRRLCMLCFFRSLGCLSELSANDCDLPCNHSDPFYIP